MGESGSTHLKSGNWANRMKSIHGLRKRNKPLVEKKRRARINESLSQLKALVIEAMQKNAPHSYSKLEKADILEMTVKHLKQLKQQMNDREMASKYHVGYNECATEVVRYLGQKHTDGTEIRSRILDHLSNRMPSGSCANSQPPSESYIRPPPEVALRLGGSHKNTMHNSAGRPSCLGVDNKQNSPTSTEKHSDFYNGYADSHTTQHSRNVAFNESRVDEVHVSTATVTRPTHQTESTCDQAQDNFNRRTPNSRYHGLPLADIAPSDARNRMPLSVDVNCIYAPECSSSAKPSLPPFQIFTQPFRQVDRFCDLKYCTAEQSMALSQNNNMQRYDRLTVETNASENLDFENRAYESPSSPNFIANGMLGIGQNQVWRPW